MLSPIPIIRLTFALFVYIPVPKIEIMDERNTSVTEKFYKGGSTIELKCQVLRMVGQAPKYILWYHQDRLLNYDTERGGVR